MVIVRARRVDRLQRQNLEAECIQLEVPLYDIGVVTPDIVGPLEDELDAERGFLSGRVAF